MKRYFVADAEMLCRGLILCALGCTKLVCSPLDLCWFQIVNDYDEGGFV